MPRSPARRLPMPVIESPRVHDAMRAQAFAKAWVVGALLYAVACTQAADDAWPMAPGDHANTRFSPLAQITTSNVKALRLAFSFDTGTDRRTAE